MAFTFPSGQPSRVTFDIEPRGETVRLTLTHSELETGEPLPTAPADMLGSG